MQNFGKIKNIFNDVLVEGILKKQDKEKNIFKSYIKLIKENKTLKTQFLVYSNLESKIESDKIKANEYVSENIDLIKSIDKKTLLESNTKLLEVIKDIAPNEEYTYKKLHEHITTLVFTPKTPLTINTLLESKEFIVNHILNNKAKEVNEEIGLPQSVAINVMVSNFNKKYDGIDECDKEILRTLINSTEEEKKNLYSKTIRECIELINEKLSTSDLDTKDRLLRVKDKLLNDKQELKEDFTSQLFKLIELRDGLNN